MACYVFSSMKYAYESWTASKPLENDFDAFELWRYRRLMKISLKDKIQNEEVLKTVKEENLHL
jgi:hypothetical protein